MQTGQVIAALISAILIVSILIDKSPTILLTGLGASAAVMMLIFKDSILGLVSGVQLALNDMLKVGDWIYMPQRDVNGIVEEVALTVVKVRAWDNTLINLPPYLLISESFENWQAMRNSGGRRVMRSINIDMSSIRFADTELLSRLRQSELLQSGMADETGRTLEGEAVTNLDLYMRYIQRYIEHHPRVRHTMLTLVRQLQPLGMGPARAALFLLGQCQLGSLRTTPERSPLARHRPRPALRSADLPGPDRGRPAAAGA